MNEKAFRTAGKNGTECLKIINSMKLNRQIYKDKVKACWIGKNIGGTIGGPYEGRREILDVKGFLTESGEPMPNDDLDLQLVWLHAVEKEGAKNITAEKLGEYWLSFIPVAFSEYGIATSNMRSGIMPPLCGDAENNVWKHSNGAWIRTEIWATLAPAMPDVAVRYAIEDAKVDHGMGEGTYAAMFVAAVESAAFAVTDLEKLIEIGLSKIPSECRVYKTIKLLCKLHKEGKKPIEARNEIQKFNADLADGWFQAPSNVAFAVLGLLYGEGDFKKSMLLAVNCGDDTDCTAATVGSIFGIMHGTKGIPEDWSNHIGDKIITCCINTGVCFRRVATCSELTEKVVRLAPLVVEENRAERQVVFTEFTDDEDEIDSDAFEKFCLPYGASEESDEMKRSVAALKPNTFTAKCGAFTAVISYEGGFEVVAGEQRKVTLKFINNVKAFGNQSYHLNIEVLLPEGVECDKSEFKVYLPHWTALTQDCMTDEIGLYFTLPEKLASVTTVYLRMKIDGRYAVYTVPISFFTKA